MSSGRVLIPSVPLNVGIFFEGLVYFFIWAPADGRSRLQFYFETYAAFNPSIAGVSFFKYQIRPAGQERETGDIVPSHLLAEIKYAEKRKNGE